MKQSLRLALTCVLVSTSLLSASFSQEAQTYKGVQGYLNDDTSLFEDVTGIKKKTDKFNLFLNIKGSGNGYSEGGKFVQGKFQMDELRIEARGDLNSWLSYRWRQKLNVSNDGSKMIDNLPTSIDYASISVRLNDKLSLGIGKQGVAYGGVEYDLNPIHVYEYSDFTSHLIGFTTGVKLVYQVDENQELDFEITNSRELKSIKEVYGVELEDAKLPFGYNLLWSGNFNDIFIPKWSISYKSLAKSKHAFIVALGNEFNLGRFNIYYDLMYSREQLDPKSVMFNIFNNGGVNSDEGFVNTPSEYLTNIVNVNYRLSDNWSLFTKGVFELSGVYKNGSFKRANSVNNEVVQFNKGLYSRSWTYLAGVEYYPSKNSNLHFFCYYAGKYYNYKQIAKQMGNENNRTSKFSVGFSYLLPMF